MGAALNMLDPGEAEVSDALLPYDHLGYGIPPNLLNSRTGTLPKKRYEAAKLDQQQMNR